MGYFLTSSALSPTCRGDCYDIKLNMTYMTYMTSFDRDHQKQRKLSTKSLQIHCLGSWTCTSHMSGANYTGSQKCCHYEYSSTNCCLNFGHQRLRRNIDYITSRKRNLEVEFLGHSTADRWLVNIFLFIKTCQLFIEDKCNICLVCLVDRRIRHSLFQ